MRLPAGRYRTSLSRASTARRKRESLKREVPEFKRRSRAESTVRSWHHTNVERAKNTVISRSVFLGEQLRLLLE